MAIDDESFGRARDFLEVLGRETRDPDGLGITRIAYGEGEQLAHDVFARVAADCGARVESDPAGNTIATLCGSEPDRPAVVVGSHLDSVRQGGNFDGAAGVAAGLACLSACRQSGSAGGLKVVAFRGEESCWFPYSYIGSRMALGSLPTGLLDTLRRSDTGLTLADHIDGSGFDAQGVREGRTLLDRRKIDSFFEVHIEQGPVLDAEDVPVAIVPAIAGGHRFRGMTVTGEWAHAGAAPRLNRRDAMAATAAFIDRANAIWAAREARGAFLLLTFGMVQTEPTLHAFSRIPGKVFVTMDLRASDSNDLHAFMSDISRLANDVMSEFGVEIAFGTDSGPPIIALDQGLMELLREAAERQGIACRVMPSGAGHDAAAFAEAGIPTALLFARNQNGSHNPDESMRLDDFRRACDVVHGAIRSRIG
jgi:beta-ureidopropionase / N-carbamoyl-L-amino-acid hydrolase